MPRRPAAHTQTDLTRLLRAAEEATGRPHHFRARPDGSIDVLPIEHGANAPESPESCADAATLAPALGDLPEPVL